MKRSAVLALILAFGISAFLLGRWTSIGKQGHDPETIHSRSSPTRTKDRVAKSGKSFTLPRATLATACKGLSSGDAKQLTSEQRMELLAEGGLVWGSRAQVSVLVGIISALTKEEVSDATRILTDIQKRGNYQSQEVWDALWIQWGRVDPERGITSAAGGKLPGHSRDNPRNLMAGWLETDPDAALAWAREPRETLTEATAAAYAISHSSQGDARQLESAILALPADSLTTKECLRDYFDLVSLSSPDQTASTIYDGLPPSLKSPAWSGALQLLSYSNPETAAAWLQQHANDPGRDYKAAANLVGSMSYKDPSATAEWSIKLPPPVETRSETDTPHPAQVAIARWLRSDPAAAKAWLGKQPPDAYWMAPSFQQMDEVDPFRDP